MKNILLSLGIIMMTISSTLEANSGENSPNEHLKGYHPKPPIVRGFTIANYHKKSTFQDAAKWGANVVRIQFNYNHKKTTTNYWKNIEKELNKIETAMQFAKKENLQVVICFRGFLPDVKYDTSAYWEHSKFDKNHIRVWKAIAKRTLPYKNYIWGFDLVNEPLDRTQLPLAPKQWREKAIKIIRGIREVNKDTWIIYEPGPGGLFAGFTNLTPLPDKKVIYSAHYYSPHIFTHQGIYNIKGTQLINALKKINIPYPLSVEALKGDTWELRFNNALDVKEFNKNTISRLVRPALEFQKKYNVPIYLGEFSVVRWAPKQPAIQYLKDVIDFCEKNGWSWTYHSFREFNGWSLEHTEKFWLPGHKAEQATKLTGRAKLLLKYLAKNKYPKQDINYIRKYMGKNKNAK